MEFLINLNQTILLVLIVVYSIIFHEVAHGYTAYKLGDPTPKYEKRLTLNPLNHIDLFGTIVLPLFTYISFGAIFGWAKPVLYNLYNLKNPNKDSVYIALAGPLTNIFLIFFFIFLYKIYPLEIFLFGIRINLILALFNLIPIPPLDGSKIFLLKMSFEEYYFLEKYGIFIILIIFIFSGNILFNFINLIQKFIFSAIL